MIEALVSLLVLSIGLMGLAFLQGQGMRFNSDAYLRTQATVLAYEIIDRMRANATTNGLGGSSASAYVVANNNAVTTAISNYDNCRTGVCDCDRADGTVTCNAANLAIFDLGEWYAAQARLLPLDPNNRATITRQVVTGTACPRAANNIVVAQYTITMRWREAAPRTDPDNPIPRTQAFVVQLDECPQTN
jgi:type IV pilus assembly protein PilV